VLSSAKYSSLSKYSLISLFFFETTNAIRNVTSNFTPTFVAVYINALSDSILVTGASYFSFESLWPSLRWQEREFSDMLGVFIANKRDRRSLFLPSLLGLSPLRRATPTSGFFEITSSPSLGLCARRLTSA
jgi:hypothetical protein